MKKLLLIITVSFMGLSLFAQVDSTLIKDCPELKGLAHTTWDALISAAGQLLSLINWMFVIVFIACATFFNEAVETDNFAQSISFLKKIPRGLRSFIIGVLFMIMFCYFYSVRVKLEVFGYILSIAASMIIMSIGVNRIVRWALENKLGMSFGNTAKNETNIPK